MNENDYIYLLLAFILGYFANSIIKQMCGQNVEGLTDVRCDPSASPPQKCPGDLPCPPCGKSSCECPTAPMCSEFTCPSGKQIINGAENVIQEGSFEQRKNLCCEDIPKHGGTDASKSDYKCGEPGGRCISCGGSLGYVEQGGCKGVTDGQKKSITQLAGLGPWVPASETTDTQCDGGKCGVWCGARQATSVPNCNWFGKKDWCMGNKIVYRDNNAWKDKKCKYDA